jgi:hypothetical protein
LPTKPHTSLYLAAALAFALPVLAPAAAPAASETCVPTKIADTKAALRDLWIGHVFWVRNVVDARFAGNAAAAKAAEQQVLANAQAIATFLSGANPYLPADTLRGLLLAHGGHHVQQIQQFQAKQYDEDAKTWAAMTAHMYVIADALAGGIARQFPDKFR